MFYKKAAKILAAFLFGVGLEIIFVATCPYIFPGLFSPC
jgi:hypothetical protein